ncbi:MAG: putative sulfate exporter family transporter [Leptolyngbya sp. SIO1D8]|nr:putative sulfate exporter family transporter [Leptolyngbya sp. SIO1D8]
MTLLPGLLLTSGVAGLAILLSQILGIRELNPLLLAVLLGMGCRCVWQASYAYRPGIQFAMKRVLRLAVILLGLRLSTGEILSVGSVGLIVLVLSASSTFYITCWLGRYLKISPKLTQLIAAGTSICGASAVVATSAAIESSEEDMAYAIAAVTGFGTLAMVSYPLLATMLGLNAQIFGIWCGISIHEVAQVIATAFQQGNVSGELATVTKLARVLLIVPMLLSLSCQNNRGNWGQGFSSIPMPWFVLCFCGLVAINSLNIVPETIKAAVLMGNQFLLCVALAAMGLETNLRQLKQIGLKPIYLAGFSWIFLSLLSLSIIQILY